MQAIESSICAVVPVYNAQATLAELTEKLIATLSRFSSYKIVLVDDCSTDGSLNVMRDLCTTHKHITGIGLKRNAGQQSAIFCGLHYSGCDYTVIIDDDLEQDPADILLLYQEILKGYEVVYGVNRQEAPKGFLRGLGSVLRDAVFRHITRIPKNLKVCSFRILTRKTAQQILKADTRFVYISMEILKHTTNIQNVALDYNTSGTSNYRLSKLAGLLLRLYIYYAPCALAKGMRKRGKCFEVDKIFGEAACE